MRWTRICSLSDLPDGAMKPLQVNGMDLLVIRSGGQISVLPPSCPHMQNPLAEGIFDGCVLTCTKHLWQWTLADGQPTGGLAESPLLKYETRLDGDEVMANLEVELQYEYEVEAEL